MPSPTPNPADFTLDPLLYTLRGHRVILDADLARLYGVMTGTLNQAIKRNPDRFPSDFAFQLIPEEWNTLNRSQFTAGSARNEPGGLNLSQPVIGSPKIAEISNKSQENLTQFAIGSQKHRNPRLLPWAFTEHGALMAATVLRSARAVQMSLYVVRAFVKLRQVVMENTDLSKRMAEAELALREHDSILVDIYDKLEPLLEPPSDPSPKRKMGFQREE